VIVAKGHTQAGTADAAGLHRGGFTGSGIKEVALHADALLGSGAHQDINEFVVEDTKAVADTDDWAIAHFCAIHRATGFDGEKNGFFAERPVFAEMPGSKESDFFRTGKCGMHRGIKAESGELAEDFDNHGTTNQIIASWSLHATILNVNLKPELGKVAMFLAHFQGFRLFYDGLRNTPKEIPGFFTGSLDPSRMIHMGTKDPDRGGLVLALAISGEQVAEGIRGQLHMRHIQQELLDLRPDMIFMKRCRGLIQDFFEDRGKRVRHDTYCKHILPITKRIVKKIRYSLETAIIRLVIWLLPKFSRQALIRMSKFFGTLAYHLDSRGRHTAQENLRKAFASEQITEARVREIAQASYRTFARTFMELFCSAGLNKENITEHIRIRYEDESTEAEAHKHGSIWVEPHFGNFEIVSLAVGFRGFPLLIVAQDFKNEALTDIFKQLRQVGGHNIIPQEGAMLRLMKALKRGGHTAILSDLTIKPNKSAMVLNCFGLKTCATTIHTSLSHRLNIPILPTVCRTLPDGTYEALVHAPMRPADFDSPEHMAQEIWNWYEGHIRQAPEAWLWMYKHWRYLPTTEPDPSYPDYANPHKGFRELLAGRLK
jgi:Kdo2-lipid IVA lauroyltransferase/acyltransferase